MSCPQNSLGQSICQIVDHPDHPVESFCIRCKRRFYQKSSINGEFGILLVLIFIAALLFTIATNQVFRIVPGAPANAEPSLIQPGDR